MGFLHDFKEEIEFLIEDFTSLESAILQDHAQGDGQDVLIYSKMGLDGDTQALVNTDQAELHELHHALVRQSQQTRIEFWKFSTALLKKLT
ncbi:MAG: hypothetical protein ACPGJS_22875 [Flammeovirgaceae bacterium]